MRYYTEHDKRLSDPYKDFDFYYDGFPGEYVYSDDVYIPEEYMDERWTDIKNAPGYKISTYGRVWSEKYGHFIKVKPMDNHGHMGVCLCINGVRHYEYIHRLMAKAFIPNPHNYPIVRHLNDDPTDNDLSNLAWGTQTDNAMDSMRNGNAYILTDEDREKGFSKTRRPIVAININTGEKTVFKGQNEASRFLNVQQANIWKVLNGERLSTCGYTFRYL